MPGAVAEPVGTGRDAEGGSALSRPTAARARAWLADARTSGASAATAEAAATCATGMGFEVAAATASTEEEREAAANGGVATTLGCGAVAEGDQIVVQGEQAPRVRAFLESQGARRIVIGS